MNINETEQRILASFLKRLSTASTAGNADEMLVILDEWKQHLIVARKFFVEQQKLIKETALLLHEAADYA